MRKPLFLIAVLALIAALTACTRPVLGSDITVTGATVQTTPVPDTSPATGLSPEEQAIADASSSDELNSLISVCISDKNYPLALKAVDRLLELDPADDAAYAMKTELLILTLKDAYEALNDALAEDVGKVSDPAGYRALVRQLYDEAGLELGVPFAPDSTSGDEINTVGASAGNLSACCFIGQDFSAWQSGVLTWQGEWVYFSEYAENFALYKMRLDGSDRQLVCAAGAASLNVVGDWIYFSNVGDNNKLYKVRTDGSLLTKLADDRCDSLCVLGDRIYYINADDGDTIYQIGTDGSEPRLFRGRLYPYSSTVNGCTSPPRREKPHADTSGRDR
jgi:tetratricopeptide (TPR) repeat protein